MQTTLVLKKLSRPGLLTLAIVLLAGCAMQSTQAPGPAGKAHAQAMYQSGDYASAAKLYQRLAAHAPQKAKAGLLISAGEAWVRAGQPKAALQALRAIPTGNITQQDYVRRALLLARIDLATQRAQAALTELNTLSSLPFSMSAQSRATLLKLKGQALFSLDSPLEATQALVQRGQLLHDPKTLAENRHIIWHGLMHAHQSLTTLTVPPKAGQTVAGWLELGKIGRTAWQAPYRFSYRVSKWQQHFPLHPANGTFIQKLLATHNKRATYPKKIAVLLPLDGASSTAAAAVRDGLFTAHFKHSSLARNTGQVPVIRIYNTHGTAAGTVSAYQQAVQNGANVIVGPLHQKALEALVNADAISIPTLALSDLPHPPASQSQSGNSSALARFFGFGSAQQPPPHPMLYQFGFDPTDEARQVAKRAAHHGLARAVILAPATAYGHQMIAAFQQQLTQLGGILLATQQYQPGQSNIARPIKRMLNLGLSHAREETLTSVLRRDLNYTPRRRQDVQYIFLIADKAQARQIRPQIRFHYGLGLPVFATSAVYEPGPHPVVDLNGVKFPDTPWLLSDAPRIESVRKQIKQLWPRQYDAASRYFALGYDAYHLLPLVTHLKTPLSTPVRGVTGLLTMDADQRIHREYDWATYKNGHVKMLAKPTAAQ